MKISFIIPVYNIEKYLNQCVLSVLEQTYRNIEVILVDDGSKDKSPAICDAFAKTDKRVRVIHKENGGASDARNLGIDAASGEYVVFVDGDDFWVDKGQLDALVKIAQNLSDCDFVGYNCSYYYPESEQFRPWVAYASNLSTPTDKNTAMIELVKSGTIPMSACLKLMKRDFLIKNELYFEKGSTAEDIPWFINVLEKCNKCSFINQYIYAYRQNREGSVTYVSGDKSFHSLHHIIETEAEKVETRNFNQDAKEALYSFLAYELSILLTYPNVNRETYKKLKSYSWLLNYDLNPKVKKVKTAKRFFGLELTVRLLKLYQKKRRSKK